MGLKEYLLEKGWVSRGGVLVRFSSPRLGWKDDGTLIVGYFERPGKVTTVEQMEAILEELGSGG